MRSNSIDALLDFCKKNHIIYQQDYPLKKLNTFRVGGNASIFIQIGNNADMAKLQKFLDNTNFPFFVLGGGSNLLISDEGFNGIVIKPEFPSDIEILEKTEDHLTFSVYANAISSTVARKASRMGYTGLEFLTTIPGTIGGALVQNAGCYGSEIGDFVCDVTICENGDIRKIYPKECAFSYRSSIFKNNRQKWIQSCTMKIKKGDPSAIELKILEFRNNRLKSQPRNRKSAGSVFKNPPNEKAWSIIKSCGFSGYQYGDAQISPEHANFIVNCGNATALDIFKIIIIVQKKVKEEYNILLEPEMVFLGKFPDLASM